MAVASIAYEGPIVTRKSAKAQGLTHYFQGSTCPKGHTAQRYTRNGECVVCALDRYNWDGRVKERLAVSRVRHRDKRLARERTRAKEQRALDPEAARARDKAYRDANPEKRREIVRRSNERHAEYVAARGRAYRASRPEYHVQNRARVKAWRLENPDAYLAQKHLRRARKVGAEGSYEPEDVRRMLHAQNGLCNGCSADIWKKYTVDHMTPLSRGGSNWPANLQLLCKRCNSAKNNRTMEEWLDFRNKHGTFKHRSALLVNHG